MAALGPSDSAWTTWIEEEHSCYLVCWVSLLLPALNQERVGLRYTKRSNFTNINCNVYYFCEKGDHPIMKGQEAEGPPTTHLNLSSSSSLPSPFFSACTIAQLMTVKFMF